MRKNLKETVYQGIYDNVTNGKYKQNDILTESMLIEEFGVSKSPVREALIELCKDGILKNIPRMGYQVIPVTLQEIIDILELRADIETRGLKKAFPLITEDNLEQLTALIQKQAEKDDQIVSNNWSKNYEFHMALYSFNGNNYAYKILSQLIRQSARYISQYFLSAWGRERESKGRYHMAIVEALKKGNIQEACDILEKDILVVKEEILVLHSMK
ncbi:MAG: GntR family transcriptional regulator [Lachnospiraceae bacterium]|jgi:DNA-binding GntR family transcriptional regulator